MRNKVTNFADKAGGLIARGQAGLANVRSKVDAVGNRVEQVANGVNAISGGRFQKQVDAIQRGRSAINNVMDRSDRVLNGASQVSSALGSGGRGGRGGNAPRSSGRSSGPTVSGSSGRAPAAPANRRTAPQAPVPKPGFFASARDRFRSVAQQVVRSLPAGAQNKLRQVRDAAVETGKAIADVARAANTAEGRQAIRSSVAFGQSAVATVRQGSRLAATISATAASAPTGVGAVVGAVRIGVEGYHFAQAAADTYHTGRQAVQDISAAAQTAEGQQAQASVRNAGSAWGKVFG